MSPISRVLICHPPAFGRTGERSEGSRRPLRHSEEPRSGDEGISARLERLLDSWLPGI
jgi:hypothetical protein